MAKFIRYLAKTTPSLTGQLVLVRETSFNEQLAENQFLHPETWEILYKNKPGANLAEKLVNRELTSAQIDLVLAKDKRIGVLSSLVTRNKLNEEQGRVLLSKGKIYMAVARAWWSSGNVPEILKGQVALDSGSMIEYALQNDNLSDEAVLHIIETHNSLNAGALEELLNKRKNLVEELAVKAKYTVKIASLGSRHLFNQDIMRNAVTVYEKYETTKQFQTAKTVLENPNASKETLIFIENWLKDSKNTHSGLYSNLLKTRFLQYGNSVEVPWEEETDLEKIKLINRYSGVTPARLKIVRSLPNLTISNPFVVKPVEKSKDKPGVKKINYGNIEVGSFTIPTEGVYPTVRWVSNELDIYGESAWEAAVMLLQTDYQGSMQDLINTSKSI